MMSEQILSIRRIVRMVIFSHIVLRHMVFDVFRDEELLSTDILWHKLRLWRCGMTLVHTNEVIK